MLHCPTCGRHYTPDFEICPEDQSPLQADSTFAGPAPVDPLVGHTLDEKYRLEEKLGVGGMGTVYRARHLLIDRPVAIKVLNQRFVEDEAARTQFRREAKAAGRLQHTNAVTVTDFVNRMTVRLSLYGVVGGSHAPRGTAKEAPLIRARRFADDANFRSVAAAHEAGIIHRDLKPANIFIVQRAEVPHSSGAGFRHRETGGGILDEDEPMTLTRGRDDWTPRNMSRNNVTVSS